MCSSNSAGLFVSTGKHHGRLFAVSVLSDLRHLPDGARARLRQKSRNAVNENGSSAEEEGKEEEDEEARQTARPTDN